jgi:hypothetical protein
VYGRDAGMHSISRVAAMLVCVVAAIASARAGEIADKAAKAEQLETQGDYIGAISALDDAVEILWRKSPLQFRKVLFVDSAEGYGVYAERDSDVFKKDEPLLVYAEPIGFAYGKNALGITEITLPVDFELQDEKGKTIYQKDDFVTVSLPVRYHNREFNMTITVRLSGLSIGKYVAKFHVRDKYSNKSGDFSLPFSVVN